MDDPPASSSQWSLAQPALAQSSLHERPARHSNGTTTRAIQQQLLPHGDSHFKAQGSTPESTTPESTDASDVETARPPHATRNGSRTEKRFMLVDEQCPCRCRNHFHLRDL
jgi:hypothetical protein